MRNVYCTHRIANTYNKCHSFKLTADNCSAAALTAAAAAPFILVSLQHAASKGCCAALSLQLLFNNRFRMTSSARWPGCSPPAASS
eukprot:11504-Heterococcus_DN1.PRE.1